MIFCYVIDLHKEEPLREKRKIHIGGAAPRRVQTGEHPQREVTLFH